MDKEYFTSYISGACNSTPHALAWGTNNLIIYGSCNAVNLYDPQQCVVTHTLVHHKGRVNSLRWIKFMFEPEKEFISASSDNTAAVWKLNKDREFTVTAELIGHTGVVTCADAIYPNSLDCENHEKLFLAATASADSTVILWIRNKRKLTCVNAGAISLGTGLCLTLRLFILGGPTLFLAIAADDSSIHLYSVSFKNISEIEYNRVFTLAGHQDWVRSMDFIKVSGTNLLASASQDTTIRLWRFSPPVEVKDDKSIKIEEKTFESKTVHGSCIKWSVHIESVLSGHEGWIYGVHWLRVNPFIPDSAEFNPLNLRLLSSSLDKSMILWAPSESGVWLEEVRVGEVGGNTLGFYGCQFSPDGESILAHGYNGSFHLWHKEEDGGLWYTGVTVGGHFDEVTDLGWDPEGQYVLSVSADQTTRLHAPWARENVLTQDVLFEVGDRTDFRRNFFSKIVWTSAGRKQAEIELCKESKRAASSTVSEKVLVTKTCPRDKDLVKLACYGIRKVLFMRNLPKPLKYDIDQVWIKGNTGVQAIFHARIVTRAKVQWHEVARPQVHGYNLQCLAILSRYRFASGAEEKVIRAFEAPANFVDNFSRLCGVKDAEAQKEHKNAPRGAAVPSLGLSNKAVYHSDRAVDSSNVNKDDDQAPFKAVILDEPPTEEHLVQNSLWPEVQKLYGHGYEIFSLTASHNGLVLASACRATSQQHAAIILWDTKSWVQIQTLMSHQLTVTQMAFSPDDKFLLTVSRDRRWSLFVREISDEQPSLRYCLEASTNKTNGVHTRVIWCCTWSHDSKYFATGSREGRIIVWGFDKSPSSGRVAVLSNDPFLVDQDAVTSIAFAPCFVVDKKRYLMAAGFESGLIRILWWQLVEGRSIWTEIITLNRSQAHHRCVKKLAFRPVLGAAGCSRGRSSFIQLASCGEDHAVKVHTFNMKKICKLLRGPNNSTSDCGANKNAKPGASTKDTVKPGGGATDNSKPGDSATDNCESDDSATDNCESDDSATDNCEPGDSATNNFELGDNATG